MTKTAKDLTSLDPATYEAVCVGAFRLTNCLDKLGVWMLGCVVGLGQLQYQS